MFKWIISFLLIIISLPIIYFNITSFYQSKREFKKMQEKFITNNSIIEHNESNKSVKKTDDFDKEFSKFNKDFDNDWKNF